MSLNFRHLRYFWAVAHEGNLTRAAETLNVSQSALSVQIRQLEERLGHDLFERRGRQLVLTEAGRIALDHADAIFATGEELVSTLRERRGETRRVLRVGANATLSRNFQIRFLEPLLGREDVDLALRSGRLEDLLESLAAHQLDVVLSNGSPPRDGRGDWIAHLIDTQPVSLIGIPRKGRQHPLRMLLAEEAIVLPSPDSSIRTGFDALAARLGVQPRIAAEVDDMAMLRLIVRQSGHLGVVPPIVVRDELERGDLAELHQLPGLVENFFAIVLQRRFPNPLLGELLPA